MIDPAAALVLETMRAEARPMPPDQGTWLAGYRARLAALPRWQGPAPAIEVAEASVDGRALRLYGPPGRTLLFIHGGGFVAGTVDAYDIPLRHLALRSGWRVAAIDYRRSPGHPYPAAPDDCFAALRWLAGGGVGGGVLAVGGDSAGGLLAAMTAARAPDAGISLALQVLLYPNADLRPDVRYPSRERYDGTVIRLDELWRSVALYAGDAAREALSPLCQDLAGTAPAYVVTNECDPLRDEGELLAARLAAAGGTVAHTRLPGMIHGALQYAAAVPAGDALITAIAERLRALG